MNEKQMQEAGLTVNPDWEVAQTASGTRKLIKSIKAEIAGYKELIAAAHPLTDLAGCQKSLAAFEEELVEQQHRLRTQVQAEGHTILREFAARGGKAALWLDVKGEA